MTLHTVVFIQSGRRRLGRPLRSGLRRQGLTILIFEQNVHNVLRTADRAYVLKNGRIVMQGERPTLLADERLRTMFRSAPVLASFS